MTSPILEKDTKIHFPHFMILKASAGSGKTHTLTERFVQFILSEKIPHNSLRNILAVTFSNNAAKEMKERILFWLKSVFFDDAELLAELLQIISLDRGKMRGKAGDLIEEILDNYSDFQVKTIDSFMTTVFKTSAIDFGYNPEFEILLSIDSLMEYSFDRFLRNVREGTAEAELFERIIRIILDQKVESSAFPWDPSKPLLEEVKKIYRILASTGGEIRMQDFSSDLQLSKERIRMAMHGIENMILQSGLEPNAKSSFAGILTLIAEDRFADIIGKGIKTPPVKKPRSGQTALEVSYDVIADQWAEVGNLIREYTAFYSRSYYQPYLKVYEEFREAIEKVKKQQGKIFIEDINRYLAEYLSKEIVPEVYFRIGETIFHFLIDEFQDTSPIQWRNLSPLLENSLSQGGSLFVVGDTKQAIYGFRDADYTIMKETENSNPFPSAEHMVRELGRNYRSLQKILDFSEKVFKRVVPENDKYREAGDKSGLTDYVQRVKEGRKNTGYAEVAIYERDNENPVERQKIQNLVQEFRTRGFGYRDIAVLTQKNEDAVRVTTWLNEKDIPFISYSNLDIRRRKITGEIVALLNFLDSPPDDLSFATFIIGDIFGSILKKDSAGIDTEELRVFCFVEKDRPPLYKSFQKEYGSLWSKYFAGLFRSSGYFPLYDLVTEVFSVFRVFETMEYEEAALVKILEAVKEFEGAGYNSLRDFLDFASDGDSGESEWNMDVPKDVDAVKVMTIHKSKGLGFPVVIVLLYEDRNRGFDYFLEEDENGIRLLKITQKILISNPDFEPLYSEEVLKDKVNRLNSLYVGFTRAEEELYVIGVKGNKESYPMDILPENDFPPSARPERQEVAGKEIHERLPVLHHHRQVEIQIRSDEIMSIAERRRGEFIHRVLYFVEYMPDVFEKELEEIITQVKAGTGADYSADEIKDTILAFLNHKEIRGYFSRKAGRTVRREQEFSDGEGSLFRMDRVIIDNDRITVIDFKTGSDKEAEEKYRVQIKTYLKILRELYDGRNVEGIIAYVDIKAIRKIN